MSHFSLLAKNHLQNRQELQKFQCSICYEISIKTQRCKGPCHRPFCLNCIGRIKHNSQDCCPNKCSSPFQTEAIPDFNIKFKCPYRPDICKKILETQEQFQIHSEKCKFISEAGRKQVFNQKYFLCQHGHQLKIITEEILDQLDNSYISFYRTVMNDLCVGCGSRSLCRALCLACSDFKKRHIYCVQCRKLPLNKTCCPMGHQFMKKLISKDNFGSVCDMCGLAGSLVGEQGWVEHACDIFICAPCYKKLPQKKSKNSKKWLDMELTQKCYKTL